MATINSLALKAGQRVGRYEIVGILGQGSFGITYLARDSKLDRNVAIKEYLPSIFAARHDGMALGPRSTEVADDFEWGRDRFAEEGKTLARLGHAPAIVRVHDFLEDHGTAYLVMELIEGETLEAQIARAGRLDAGAIETIFWPLLDGLVRVHLAGFLHRDIKPANILINSEGRPTLIDFGASRAAIAGRTTALTAIFTPGYASAEQFAMGELGPWTDIYGLSATAYHAIVGQPPPTAAARMLHDTLEPLARRRDEGFSPGFLAGIDRGLALRIADRPHSIAEWRRSFTMAARGGSAPTIVLPASAKQDRGSRRSVAQGNWRRIVMSSVALLVGIVAASMMAIAVVRWPNESAPPQSASVVELNPSLPERRSAAEEEAERTKATRETREKAEAELAARQFAEEEEARRQSAARKQAEEEAARLAAIEDVARQKAEAEALRRTEEVRRKADAEAAARRLAEEQATMNAEAERRAAEAAREKAEAEDAVKRQVEEAARRQAEEAARRQAEDTARQTAEAEEIARKQAEEVARRKAEAEEIAKKQADSEAAQKADASAAETTLRLSPVNRQQVQVALNSLGFDTRGIDGVFGPRSREMIAVWQKSRGYPPTGFLSAEQHRAMLKAAAAAVQRFDDDQKKVEEVQKKAEAEAKSIVATTPQSFDGPWRRDRTAQCEREKENISFSGLTVRDGKFSYTSVGEHHRETCAVQVNADGSFQNFSCLLHMEGRFSGDSLQLKYLSPSYGSCVVSARRGE